MKEGKPCTMALWLMALMIWPAMSKAVSPFGLQFGEPMPYPQCPSDEAAASDLRASDGGCWVAFIDVSPDKGTNRISLQAATGRLPEFVHQGWIHATTLDGDVMALEFRTFGADRWSEAVEGLSEQFGPPDMVPEASNAVRRVLWTLGTVSVEYVSMGWDGGPSTGSVVVTSKLFTDYVERTMSQHR